MAAVMTTALQNLHKLTPLMVAILEHLNEHEPCSGDQLGRALWKSSQGVGRSLSGLHDRNLVRVHRYDVGASCEWITVKV